MELKFIWIKKYKNLENIGFNFSVNKHFEFQNEGLIVSEKENIVPKDFYSPTIKNLTVIVGKNGAGKTNLSEFLNYNLAHVVNGGLSTFLKKGEGIIVIGNNIFFQEDISIKNQKILEREGYIFKSFKSAPLDTPDGEIRWHEMEVNKYIYYNPVFDFRVLRMDNNFNNISNISTNYLVNSDINLSIKHHNNPKTILGNNYDTDVLSAHYRNEKIRESDLLLNYPKIKEYVTNLPNKLVFTLDITKENKLLVRESYSEEEITNHPQKRDKIRMYDELQSLKNYFGSLFLFQEFKENSGDYLYKVPESLKKEHFIGLFWVNFFTILIKKDSVFFPKDFFRRFIYEEEYNIEDLSLSKKLVALKRLLVSFVDNCKWKEPPIDIRDNDEPYNSVDVLKIFRTAYYTIENRKKQVLVNLINKTTSILEYEVPFHYQFIHEFSSGEQTLINFYSRFYWVKNEIAKKEQSEYGIKGERIIIFIDEGEVSYHPEWQRKYFNMAINFLTNLFEGKELQLIFSTHSPFVLSDIPKENIIFLDKDSKNKTEVKNYGRDQTFGANIYTLLSDSFFMNGTIGEFAAQQIEWSIKELEKGIENIHPASIEKIDFIINSIGEPLIKMQLEKLRNKSQEASEVTQLRKKLEELENQIKKRKDDSASQE